MAKKISDLALATTPLAGTELVEIVQGGVSKKVAASTFSATSASREKLSAARTYYVRTDGSDSNDGLSNTSGGAFLTIQKAVDVICGSLDLENQSVTIQCNDATRTEKVQLKRYIGSLAPSLIGNTTTPANALMSATSGTCFSNSSSMPWAVSGFKMTTTTSGSCLMCNNGGSDITFSNCDFGVSASSQIIVSSGAKVVAKTNYTISGGSLAHVEAVEGGIFNSGGRTVTLSGTPGFSIGYVYGRKGHFVVNSMTFSGSATGPRFALNLCTTVFSNGGAEASYFPGNSTGSKNTGSEWA